MGGCMHCWNSWLNDSGIPKAMQEKRASMSLQITLMKELPICLMWLNAFWHFCLRLHRNTYSLMFTAFSDWKRTMNYLTTTGHQLAACKSPSCMLVNEAPHVVAPSLCLRVHLFVFMQHHSSPLHYIQFVFLFSVISLHQYLPLFTLPCHKFIPRDAPIYQIWIGPILTLFGELGINPH